MENYKPKFLKLNKVEQKATLEAIIFSSDEPVTIDRLFDELVYSTYSDKIKSKQITDLNVVSENSDDQTSLDTEISESLEYVKDDFKEMISEINKELESSGRPYKILEIAGGYQFATRKEYGELLQQTYKSKIRKRLSQASLETLAIIAYKQPISKPEIEKIRGVNSNEIVNSLIDKSFVQISGRSEEIGKPLLYSTTKDFLKTFGLNSINDLPKLRELDDIAADSETDIHDASGEVIIEVEESKNEDNFKTIDIEKMN